MANQLGELGVSDAAYARADAVLAANGVPPQRRAIYLASYFEFIIADRDVRMYGSVTKDARTMTPRDNPMCAVRERGAKGLKDLERLVKPDGLWPPPPWAFEA